jgi:hypothetical protein
MQHYVGLDVSVNETSVTTERALRRPQNGPSAIAAISKHVGPRLRDGAQRAAVFGRQWSGQYGLEIRGGHGSVPAPLRRSALFGHGQQKAPAGRPGL